MVVAEMQTRELPVEVFRLDVESEGIRQERIERRCNLRDPVRAIGEFTLPRRYGFPAFAVQRVAGK